MVKPQKQLPVRRNPRLSSFDYTTPGAYFVTICTEQFGKSLGKIEDGRVVLSKVGQLVDDVWKDQPNHYPGLSLDCFVLMPDHFHAICWLTTKSEKGNQTVSLQKVIQGFKSYSTKAVNQFLGTPGGKLWQRSFYDHVIRSDEGLHRIREYILTNPASFELNQDHERRTTTAQVGRWLDGIYNLDSFGPSSARPLQFKDRQ